MVCAVNTVGEPTRIEVFLFDSSEVRRRFVAAYAARVAGGHVVTDGFGIWVNLDKDNRNAAISVGSRLAAEHKPVTTGSPAAEYRGGRLLGTPHYR
jgi:hypothetical protein